MIIGDMVSGTDLFGKEVEGKLEKVLKSFSIGIVRTGRDNTQVTQCNLRDIKIKQDY